MIGFVSVQPIPANTELFWYYGNKYNRQWIDLDKRGKPVKTEWMKKLKRMGGLDSFEISKHGNAKGTLNVQTLIATLTNEHTITLAEWAMRSLKKLGGRYENIKHANNIPVFFPDTTCFSYKKALKETPKTLRDRLRTFEIYDGKLLPPLAVSRTPSTRARKGVDLRANVITQTRSSLRRT